jgi:hyperosmotically inducible protein
MFGPFQCTPSVRLYQGESVMTMRKLRIALLGTVALLVASTAFAAAATDATTTLKVKLALLEKLGVDSLQIDVDTNQGAVALNGSVDKRATLELATSVAKSVDGVASVKNNLRLEAREPRAGSALAEAESEVKDALLETRIRIALVDKLGGDGFRVGTEAASGVVTLEFEPAWTSARRSDAIAAAKGVEGVSKVVSVDKKG